jgi:AcrR family transcriptional regulator
MTQLHLVDPELEEQIASESPKLGRKRDLTRDPAIMDAALEVLAESGYDGMTIDMVAARAKAGKATLYRRWPSKAELVIDAVSCMKNAQIASADLPDTGTLRGDLVAMVKAPSIKEGETKLKVMAGVVSMLSKNPELADVVNRAIVEPRASVNRVFFRRAIDRGEISPNCDVETLALISPSMAAYRVLILRKAITREFLISLIDGVIIPAVGLSPPNAPARAARGPADGIPLHHDSTPHRRDGGSRVR